MKDTVYLPPTTPAYAGLRMDDYVFLNRCRQLAIKHSNKPVLARGFVDMYYRRKQVMHS